jgi:hypothetical protein
MYLWTAVGHDTAEGPVRTGIGDGLPALMRSIETLLLSQRAFVGRVIEVVPRLSVAGLQEVYVPTGREWTGRRDNRGGVHWAQTFRSADPDVAYSLAGEHDMSGPGVRDDRAHATQDLH